MANTSKLGLPLLANGASNQTVANTTFALINQLLMASVVDKDLSTPPSSPANESLYIVTSGNWGTTSSKAGQLAFWLSDVGTWTFIVPRAGWAVRVLDELDSAGLPIVYGYTGSAWVQQPSSGGGGSSVAPVVTDLPASRALALTDADLYLRSSGSTAIAVTIPPQTSVTWAANTQIHFEQGGSGALTFVAGSGVTLNKMSSVNAKVAAQYGVATLKRVASDVWTLFGALESST